MNLLLGLCSVALRARDPAEVVTCATAGGAVGIEWEARVHVPAGDVERARRAAGLSRDAGLLLPSYGSYVRAGSKAAREEFGAALKSASELSVQTIRVWAGDTRNLPEQDRGTVAAIVSDDLRAMCQMAADVGMSVSLEFHPGTFTETATSTEEMVRRVACSNLYTYWQPDYGQPLGAASASLQQVQPLLSHVHVFCWEADHTRLPLEKGRDYWQTLLLAVAASPTRAFPRFAMLEFSRDDAPEQVVGDLRVLASILRNS